MAKGLFVTGTGTDIGKTYISALLLKRLNEAGLSCAYFKAAMSGNERLPNGELIPGDAKLVKSVSGIDQPLATACPYVYERAVSPHLASRLEGGAVDMAVVREYYARLCEEYDYILSEGSGGIVCPIRYDERVIMLPDIIKALGLPCIIVADSGLGTINSVVLTYEYMKAHGIAAKGLILNRFHRGDAMEEDNKLMCGRLTSLPVLACVGEGDKDISLDADTLAALFG
ncbi:MAG: dethiobiotin synthase [Ruminococcus sp.]|nr:dethiobiotin synthase [Ruminococcus sp.]